MKNLLNFLNTPNWLFVAYKFLKDLMIKIWNWIKINLGVVSLLIISPIAIALLEVKAEGYIKERIQKIIEIQKIEFWYRNDKNIIDFKNKYIDRLNHLRGPRSVMVKETPPSNVLFSVLRSFYKNNNQNILIHEDSWADAAGTILLIVF